MAWETESNVKGIRQGTEDLTEKVELKPWPPLRDSQSTGRPQVIISSPYERAKETAEIIGKELKIQ